jgi:micrococcal nuclease
MNDLFLIIILTINLLFPAKNNLEINFTKRVIDGDTIELITGEKVRYLGVNTPEVKTCFGDEATKKNKELVELKTVKLEKDISNEDKYGRRLRYVYVGDVFVNDELVKQGFANVATYPPDVKFAGQFLESEKYARENKLGLWNTCKK